MFYLPFSKFIDSSEAVVAPGAVILAEGQALVRQAGATAAGVLPSAGVAGEKFIGFAIAGTTAAPFAEDYTNKVEKLLVPATGAVTLQRTPIAGQVFVYDNTEGSAVASPTVTGNQVTGLTAGNEVTITYKFALTQTEALALYGDVQPGGYSGARVGQIGVIKRGMVYTSEFDAAVDWNAATAVKLAANGQLTNQAGTGVEINAVVIAVPTVEVPFLGLEFSAP